MKPSSENDTSSPLLMIQCMTWMVVKSSAKLSSIKGTTRSHFIHPDSRPLTTFSTHVGCSGTSTSISVLSCAAEIFRKKVLRVVKSVAWHLYWWHRTTWPAFQTVFFANFNWMDWPSNLLKCQFRVPTMSFFGHVVSEKRMSPDPRMVVTLQNVTPPTNVSEVRGLLSSAASWSRFIRDFAAITKLRRQLTCGRSKVAVDRRGLSFSLSIWKPFCLPRLPSNTLIPRNRRPYALMVAPLVSALSWPKKRCWRRKWHWFTTQVGH